MKNDEETEKAQDISVSTLKNTSIAEPHKDATANVSSVEKKLEKLMVEPATTEAQVRRPTPAVSGDSSESTKEEKPSSSSWTNPILRNNKNPTTDTHPGRSRRLEAYVLQPGVEPSKDGIIWSSKVIPLNLDETAVRAHLSKLGPEYSIINTICELLPAQLVVLQEQAQNRNGRLVSVQCSTPADIVTTMGITWFTSESATQVSRPPRLSKTPAQQQRVMPQQRNVQKTYTEGDVFIAISDITSKQIRSERRAAAVHKVPRSTIQDRRAGRRPQRDCEPKSKRLTKLEEEAIVQRVLEEGLRGIPPSKACVRDMADRLLRERGGKPTGKNWIDNFIKRTPKLRTRWSRPYDRQRAVCEDPAVIQPWFSLVQSMKAKYSIVDEDT